MESDFCFGNLWFCFLFLVFLTWLIDIRKNRNGRILSMFLARIRCSSMCGRCVGYSAREVITVSGISLQGKVYTSILLILPDTYLASLIYGLLFIGFNYLIVWGLYKKRIFIKI